MQPGVTETERRWDQIGAASGLAYVVLSVTEEHLTPTRVAFSFWSLAMGPLVVFIARFYTRLQAREGGSATGAAVLFGSALVGVLQLFYVPVGSTDAGLFDPTEGALGAYATYGSHFVWIAAASVIMLREAPAPRAAPAVGLVGA